MSSNERLYPRNWEWTRLPTIRERYLGLMDSLKDWEVREMQKRAKWRRFNIGPGLVGNSNNPIAKG